MKINKNMKGRVYDIENIILSGKLREINNFLKITLKKFKAVNATINKIDSM
ncbi:hypothetical protein [Blattabacterium sp. (Blattella germanica)]|uniref:hypothetical protein n=1 Tax=Blattabacterium sp. (Blattella germanica) TaxID=624186 RepID=UPI0002D38A7C|nr:hypothetical protein [Blattabacterium sp. (Blattella germanica)]